MYRFSWSKSVLLLLSRKLVMPVQIGLRGLVVCVSNSSRHAAVGEHDTYQVQTRPNSFLHTRAKLGQLYGMWSERIARHYGQAGQDRLA